MASSDSQDDTNVPILWLPDELLIKICSYITKIPNKIGLEHVCRRLRFIASQYPCWKAIHSLELKMEMIEKGRKKEIENSHLNNYPVRFTKWPAAVQLLVNRTKIRRLIIHCIENQTYFEKQETVLADIMEIFRKNEAKIRIECIEFYYSGQGKSEYRSSTFLFDSLRLSIPYLKEITIDIDPLSFVHSLSTIWPIIKECKHLTAISCLGNIGSCNVGENDLLSLLEKPLTKMLFRNVEAEGIDFQTIQILNSSTAGVEHLTLVRKIAPHDMDLKEFCDRLSEKSREKLKYFATNDSVFYDSTKYFPLIPSIFPNLETLVFERTCVEFDFPDNGINQLFNNMISFLSNAQSDSFSRQIVVHKLILCDIDAFIDKLSQNHPGITIEAEMEEGDEDEWLNFFWRGVISIGNASIRINKAMEENIHDESDMDISSDDEDDDDDDDDDDMDSDDSDIEILSD